MSKENVEQRTFKNVVKHMWNEVRTKVYTDEDIALTKKIFREFWWVAAIVGFVTLLFATGIVEIHITPNVAK